MAWTSADDVLADWIGHDVPDNDETLRRWIERAERLLRREFPDLTFRVESDDEPDLMDTIRDVVSAMVTRVFRNPEGIRQRQETDGSFTGSITFGGDQPGMLTLLDAERDALRAPGEAKSGKAFSIQVSGGRYEQHLPWCDVMFSTKSCSCGASIADRPIYEGGRYYA